MLKTTEEGVRKVAYALGAALLRNGTLHAVRQRVRAVLDTLSWMDVRMKADVAREAEALARANIISAKESPWSIPRSIAYNIDGVMKAFNRSYRKAWKRTAETYVASRMKMQRGRAEPIVLYLVSRHQKPQPAHEPLQGTVLVDRFWRAITNSDPRVESYVAAHKTKTVQWAMGAPHYLLTRPNCKHYLIPIRTDEATNSTLHELNKRHQKSRPHVHRPITDAQRWQAYKALRSAVLSSLERIAPAKRKASA